MFETLANNPGLQLLLLAVACGLVGWVKWQNLKDDWALFRAWQAAGKPEPEAVSAPAPQPQLISQAIDLDILPGAGRALAKPPASLDPALAHIRQHHERGVYTAPLGWCVDEMGRPYCVAGDFIDDVYHVLITAQTRGGKDNTALNMLFALAQQYTPSHLQICIIDGKGLDFARWRDKAHCWRLAREDEDIQPAMVAISAERKRRGQVLERAGADKWEEYQGADLPLLVIYISELSLLGDAVGANELTGWLNSELAAGAAYGMRFIISTQTASNYATRWRSQVSLYLAGFQADQAQDQPNTGLSASKIKALGALPPSELPPAAGVFTAVQGRNAITIRASLLGKPERARLLASMPDKPLHQRQPAAPALAPSLAAASEQDLLSNLLQTSATSSETRQPAVAPVAATIAPATRPNSAPLAGVALHAAAIESSVSDTFEPLPVAPELIPADEQRRILAAAREASSRRQVCLKLYEVTGGQKYTWVQQVCNAAGLLVTDKAAA